MVRILLRDGSEARPGWARCLYRGRRNRPGHVQRPNRLQLIAINGGGEAVESFTVAHLPIPEWLEIDRPSSPLSQAEFTLTGRVNWSGAASPEED